MANLQIQTQIQTPVKGQSGAQGAAQNVSGARRVAAEPERRQAEDVRQSERRTAPEQTREAQKDRTERTAEAEDAALKQFGSVVSTSEDGDTVRVSDEGEERLEEDRFGQVIPLEDGNAEARRAELVVPEIELPEAPEIELPEEEAVQAAEETADAEESTYEPQITSYAGYSDSQLEQMWLKGEISKIDYDQEIDSREAEQEARQTQNTELSSQMAGANQAAEQAARGAQQIETAFDEGANSTVDAATRVAAMTGLEDVAFPNA